MGARFAAAAIVATALVCLGSSGVLADPVPSPTSNLCDQVDATDSASFLARLGCDLGPGVQRAVGDAAGQVAEAAAGAAEVDLNTWLANGAAWMIQSVAQIVVGNSTTPDLNPAQAASFAQVYGRVVGVALSLSVLLVLIGIIEATLTRRPGGLRRVVAGMAVSGIGLGAVPVGTAVLVRITDDLSAYVGGQAEGVATGLGQMVAVLVRQPTMASGDAAFALVAVGLIGGGALLWLEMVVRASLIYVFVGVAPLACAAAQWPRLESVLRQVLFGGVALIVSKLVVVIVLVLGFAVLPAGGGLTGLLGGTFIVLIAALMPFATAKVLPLAAEEMALNHQGRLRGWAASSVSTTSRLVSSLSGFGSAGQVRSFRPVGTSGRSLSPQPPTATGGRVPHGYGSGLSAAGHDTPPPRPVGPRPRRTPGTPEPHER